MALLVAEIARRLAVYYAGVAAGVKRRFTISRYGDSLFPLTKRYGDSLFPLTAIHYFRLPYGDSLFPLTAIHYFPLRNNNNNENKKQLYDT